MEVGPRIFNQDVDTTYFNLGLDGVFNLGDRSFSWDANYVHAENKAEQAFLNGYNMQPTSRWRRPDGLRGGCPGQVGSRWTCSVARSRPMTQEMID